MKQTQFFKTTVIATILGISAMMAMGTANADNAPTSFNQDPVSLLQAIALAETNTGAVTIDAEREVKMGKTFYEISLIDKNGEKIQTGIDVQTGDVIFTDTLNNDDDADDKIEDALFISGLKSGQYLSIEDVVKDAEAQFGGKAWSVEMDNDNTNVSYEINLMTINGQQIETKVSGLASSATK